MSNPLSEILDRVLNSEIDFEKVGRHLAIQNPDLFLAILEQDQDPNSIVRIYDAYFDIGFKFTKKSIDTALAMPTSIEAIKRLREYSEELNNERMTLRTASEYVHNHYKVSDGQ